MNANSKGINNDSSVVGRAKLSVEVSRRLHCVFILFLIKKMISKKTCKISEQ